jgi:hypothetical protein
LRAAIKTSADGLFSSRESEPMSRNLIRFALQLLWLVAACDSGGLDSHGVQVPARLFFTMQPKEVIAGVAMSPAFVVKVLDERANTVMSARTRITLALGNNPGGGTLSGTVTVAAVNGVAAFSDLSLDTSGTGYTLVAEATGLGRATSDPFRVTFAPAKLVFQVQPSSAALAEAIGPPVKVAVLDVQENIVTTAAMSVTLAIETNPSGGTLAGNTTAVVENGVARFPNLLIDKPGRGYTLTASAGGVNSATSAPFTVGGFLIFTVQPTLVVPGFAIRPAVAVKVVDERGNIVTSGRTSVTLALGNNPGGGTLSGTVTVPAVDGVATFRDLSLDTSGTGYTLVAEATALSRATSSPFKVTFEPAQLVFQVQPSWTRPGQAIFPPVQVAVLDVQGNTIESGMYVTLALENNPTGGTLGGDVMAEVVNGVATFPNLLIDKSYWGYTLTASASSADSVTSTSFAVLGYEANPPPLDAAALKLYASASVHAFVAALPFVEALYWRSVWTNGPCPWGGAMEVFLDGIAPAPGTMLAPGSHTLAVNYAHCQIYGGGWEPQTLLNGAASATYTTTDLNDLPVLVSLNSVQVTGDGVVLSDLYDVTADGSGTWRRLRTDTSETTTYTPAIGSTLTNNETTHVATFGGGSYTSRWGPTPPGFSAFARADFDNLVITISGVSCTLNGSLESVYGFDSRNFHAGEVRITRDGVLVARIFGDVNGTLRTEVLTPLPAL